MPIPRTLHSIMHKGCCCESANLLLNKGYFYFDKYQVGSSDAPVTGAIWRKRETKGASKRLPRGWVALSSRLNKV